MRGFVRFTLFVVLYLLFFFVVGWSAINHTNIPFENSWAILGDSATRMKGILVASPIISMPIAMMFSAALLMSGAVKPGLAVFFRTLLNFVFSNMIVFALLAWVIVGRGGAEAWVKFLGSPFYLYYFLVCPASGLAAATMFTKMVEPLLTNGKN